ncbi:MAG: TIGR03617 family F420-dependent LLM class oxidoreductase [Candidatus Promineifilaceae bacterium]|nr:TIGR03617 family F420-dependent LLM class oxidoreductase [Candidatus Promineifilaceae bacterium]
MKFDTWLLEHSLEEMPSLARAAEAIGFDGLWTAEAGADPFLPLTLAAEHTEQLNLGTSIATAFPRTPTILAHLAWDLARYSGGRFIMGLGTQVKAHNERRLGAPWDRPLRRMRETVEAIRAIWHTWQEGDRLNYQGEFFNLDLMTPFFSGKPLDVPPPPIFISAINEGMLRLAGEVCDGASLHPFHSARYLREFAWPHIEQGLQKSGRPRDAFTALGSVFVIPTDGRKPEAEHEQFVREQLSFYMSTPAYRVVVRLHGWEETAKRLSQLARDGKWGEMPALLTDEMLDTFSVRGRWADIPHVIRDRYDGLLDRVSYYLPFVPGEEDDGWRASVAAFQ